MADEQVINLVNLKVLPHVPDSDKKTIGLIAIVTIAETIISLIVQCRNLPTRLKQDETKVLNLFKNPTLINKARLYMTLRRQARKDGTLPQFKTMVNAVLDAGKNASKEDIALLCEAAAKSSA